MSAKRRPKQCQELSGSDAPEPEVDDAGGDLTGPQAKAIAALLQEPTMQRAAEVAGVSVRTLQRWAKEENFHRALLRARREAFGQAVGLTQRLAPMAVATFAKVMNDAAAPAAAKVSAAVALLKFGREGIAMEDFAARLEALERKAQREAAQQQPEQRPPMRLVKEDGEADPPGGDAGANAEDVT